MLESRRWITYNDFSKSWNSPILCSGCFEVKDGLSWDVPKDQSTSFVFGSLAHFSVDKQVILRNISSQTLKKGVFHQYTQYIHSRFEWVVLLLNRQCPWTSVPSPPNTPGVLTTYIKSVVPKVIYEVRFTALEGHCVSSKGFPGSKTRTREVAGRKRKELCFPDERSLICLQDCFTYLSGPPKIW